MKWIHESGRIYAADDAGAVVAEVTFPALSENLVKIQHTFVDESLRGQGIAGQLMEETVKVLRNEGKKAVPTCPYARRWFSEHPGCRDVVKPPD